MSLEQKGHIELPAHIKTGGFDHAAVHQANARLYVAHTSNDALDVIDCANDQYLYSIPNLAGVAGALVSEERNLVFTSNRGENTVGIFAPNDEANLIKVRVGIRPNGLAFDPTRGLLLAANVGDPVVPNSFTVSIVDVKERKMIADVLVPGRTRWTVFDPRANVFYVNIADPAQVVVIHAEQPSQIARVFEIPAVGPHGLDLDIETARLFCACDGKKLIALDIRSGNVLDECELSGPPDVIFFNAALQHLYIAIGDPGVIEVFDTNPLQRIQLVPTENGAHTMGFDAERNKLYAFLPQTHRATIYVDVNG
jgi:DNA-binding beta-propeller fold protein YncE